MKSHALMCMIEDVRDIHSDESVGGRSVRHTSVKFTPSALSFEKRWDEACCMYASNHTHAVHYSRNDAGRLFACGTCHEFANSFLRTWTGLKTSPTSSCPSSTPARTTWMTSAVKTKECTRLLLLLRALSYGRSPEAGVGEGEIAGVGSRCSLRRKLNNFKVHLLKRRKTYFNTSFALSLTVLVGAPPLYVCLRQCERVRVCVILWCISILLHLCCQKVSCWEKE